MKRKYGDAMRAKAARRWLEVGTADDDADETLNWHDEWAGRTWAPSPAETAAMNEYLAANPQLPF